MLAAAGGLVDGDARDTPVRPLEGTTASAPTGIGAPVMMRTAVPEESA